MLDWVYEIPCSWLLAETRAFETSSRTIRDVCLAWSNCCEPGRFFNFFFEVGGRRRRKIYILFEVDEAQLCISPGP